MSQENEGWGLAPALLVVIFCAGMALIGALVVLPAIDKWQAGNAQVAAINAAAQQAIAIEQAERDIAIAKEQAERDVQIAREEASASVQRAALDLAGRAVDSTAGTLRFVIVGLFALALAVLTAVTYFLDLRIRIK
jgi:hypothetical protein